jgi:hypothetical protein
LATIIYGITIGMDIPVSNMNQDSLYDSCSQSTIIHMRLMRELLNHLHIYDEQPCHLETHGGELEQQLIFTMDEDVMVN